MQLHLETARVRPAQTLPPALNFMQRALWHQVQVYHAASEADIILDLAPTGTGKTQAGLLTLLHQPKHHAVYIAPTNALIHQQAEAAHTFLQAAGLNHYVVAANAASIRQWPGSERPGEKLHNVLRNPGYLFPEASGRPILLVTNPDIFYYATFFAYHRLDRINVAKGFIQAFNTVIFDEFHLYDAKQLSSLIFYMVLSKVLGFFDHQRKMVLLTATPEPACETLLERLSELGVRLQRVQGESSAQEDLPVQTALEVELCAQSATTALFLDELVSRIQAFQRQIPDGYGAVILDSLDQINRLADRLQELGLPCGRITGPLSQKERQQALSYPLLLATQTVDVGFNFRRQPEPERQNLDWILFTAREPGCFWQRLGRVGRILGKKQQDQTSWAVGYLPERVWEELQRSEIKPLDRTSLKTALADLEGFQKPFHSLYWRSDALLELARPIVELERLLHHLPEHRFIADLFENLRQVIAEGRGRSWSYYRWRQKILTAAERLSKHPQACTDSGGKTLLKEFIKNEDPKAWALLEDGTAQLQDFAEALAQSQAPEVCAMRQELQVYAQRLRAAYAPLFRFRQSLFRQWSILDLHHLISDEDEEVNLDPLHVLRHYEFYLQQNKLILSARAEPNYVLFLDYTHAGSSEDFELHFLNRPTALKGVRVQRQTRDGAIAPSPVLSQLSEEWLAGVLICQQSNAPAYWRLYRKGLRPFEITVSCLSEAIPRKYVFYPHLEGWLALAQEGVRLRLPDNNEPWIV